MPIKIPLFTVITIILNAKKDLEATLQSVQAQTFQDYEYIVVDGGSIDGSLDLIRRMPVSTWISEPDNGLYDAMNKGVKLSKGKWVLFLNAGDTFFNQNSLQDVSIHLSSDPDVLYGDVKIQYPNGFSRISRANKPLQALKNGMFFSHQSVFVKRTELEFFPFNLSYRFAADFNLFWQLTASGKNFLYITQPISTVTAEGLSDKYRLSSISEWKAISKFYLLQEWQNTRKFINFIEYLKYGLYFNLLLGGTFFKIEIKKRIPAPFLKRILLIKYALIKP